MGKLFGTDGIRGVANQYPMTCEIAVKTGRAAALLCKKNNDQKVIIGKDTRISGGMLEAALCAGVASAGVDVLTAGVIPTPGIAFLCRQVEGVGAGIVISASHNPYKDNGIKIFKKGGIKLSDDEQAFVENYILEQDEIEAKTVGLIAAVPDADEKYAAFLRSKFPVKKPSKKLKIIIDCSNGAASKIGQMVFDRDLFDTSFIHNMPDGKNINDGCGSQHTDDLITAVVEKKADLGLAFDGDADRLIAVDETGREITGDQILAICAIYAKETKKLSNNILVTTIMSNVGLGRLLAKEGIRHLKAGVGDRRVLELMKESGAVIGGEDSGHMIFLDDHSTGDGMLSALKLIEVLLKKDMPLSELAGRMTVFPQVLKNVEVPSSKPDFTKNKTIVDAIQSVEDSMEGEGRVLVRYSGTQPMIRVMVEGPDQDLIEKHCQNICEIISKTLS